MAESKLHLKKPRKTRRILGIDPGTNVLGWGVIEVCGASITLCAFDILNMQKLSSAYDKLGTIFSECTSILQKYSPQEVAIEAPFQGKNVQSMLKLGRAQGVAIAAAHAHGTQIFEYAPRKIKQSVAGNGNASKEQLAKMVQQITGMDTLPAKLDATDGLAAALCHHFQQSPTGGSSQRSSYGSWSGFIKQNQDRVKE